MPPSHSPSPSSDSDSDSDLLSALETSIDTDPSLGAYRAQRLQQLHSEHALAKQLRAEGHGTYSEIQDEKELMEKVTATRWCVVHFFKDGFRRCAVMDGHLKTLSTNPAHIRTLFTRINVTNAPFLVTKLRIRVLPCVIAFVDSVATDRIIGFEGLGDPPSGPPSEPQPNGDDFPTDAVEARLSAAGVLSRNEGSSLLLRHQKQRGGRNGDGDDDDGEEDDDDDG